MGESPTEYRREPPRTPQHAQPVDEGLQYLPPPLFDRWRNTAREQLEQPQQLLRKEDEGVERDQQHDDHCARPGGE